MPETRSEESAYISAIEYTTHKDTALMPTQPQIITGGPPALTPVIRTPPNALQLRDISMLGNF